MVHSLPSPPERWHVIAPAARRTPERSGRSGGGRHLGVMRRAAEGAAHLLLLLLPLLLLFASSLPAPLPALAADWPCLMGDPARTGRTPDPAPAFPREMWRVRIPSATKGSPVVAGGLLYLGGSDGILRALDAATGEERWTFRAGGPVTAAACVHEGSVYFGSSDRILYRLGASDGAFLFAFDAIGQISSSPAVSGDTVFVSTKIGLLHAVHRITGEPIWTAQLEQSSASSPIVHAGRVHIAANDGTLYTFDAASGATLHRFPTLGTPMSHTPALIDGSTLLYAPGILDRRLYAIDAALGTELWNLEIGAGGVPAAPAPAATRHNPSALRRMPTLAKVAPLAADGVTPAPGAPPRSPSRPNYYVATYDPTLIHNSLGITSDDARIYLISGFERVRLFAFDRATRGVAWAVDLGVYEDSPGYHPVPVVLGDTVALPDPEGTLLFLDSSTGMERAALQLGEPTHSCPAVADGRIFIATRNGWVVAIGPGADPFAPDSVAPVFSGFDPPDGAEIAHPRPLISVRVVDDAPGVNWSALHLELDGAPVEFGIDPDRSELLYQVPAPLSPGAHTLRVAASDLAGNAGEATWTFTVLEVPDEIPPVFVARYPAPGDTVTVDSPEIVLEIRDEGGAGFNPASLTFLLDDVVHDGHYDPARGTFTHYPSGPLAQGVHTAQFRGRDLAGNFGDPLVWSFTIAEEPDALPPEITPLEPLEGAVVTATRRPRIAARVADAESGVDPGRLTLTVDGLSIPSEFDAETGILSGTPHRFLPSGERTVGVIASDRKGAVARSSWTFTIDFAIVVSSARVSDVCADGATVTWRNSPLLTGEVLLASAADLSGAVSVAAATEPSNYHAVRLTGLTPETEYHFTVRSGGEGESRTDDAVYRFRTFAASAPLADAPFVHGRVMVAGAGMPGVPIYLTVERDGLYTLPLSTVSGDGGGFAVPLGRVRDGAGVPFPAAANDILRLSATLAGVGTAFLAVPLPAADADFEVPDLVPSATIAYPLRLPAGIHTVSLVYPPAAAVGAFDLLRDHPAIREASAFDSATQSYLTAARAFGEPVGIDFPLSAAPAGGLLLTLDEPLELSLPGPPDPPADAVPLPAGLAFTRLPGAGDLPDNPVAGFGARALLSANPAFVELTGFNAALQRFESCVVIDGAVRGDDFALRHDRAYFLHALTPADLTAPSLVEATPPAAAPARSATPAAVTRAAGMGAPGVSRPVGLPPRAAAGRVIGQHGRPLAGVPLELRLRVGPARSLPLPARTDGEGYFVFTLANFRFIERIPAPPEPPFTIDCSAGAAIPALTRLLPDSPAPRMEDLIFLPDPPEEGGDGR